MTSETFRYQFRKVLKDVPKICLLGIRGYSAVNRPEDAPKNIYDDAIIRCIDGRVDVFTASVDPGSFYINNPINPMGCAKLHCGLWEFAIGEHHAHPALVQSHEMTVDRLDKTGRRVGEETGFYGINLHSGGPEYLVGRYSAGCQVIHTSEPWKGEWSKFFDPIKEASGIFQQKRIPYLLIDKLEAVPIETLT